MKRRPFTLVEILTVLAIILILAGLSVPIYSKIMRGVQEKQTRMKIAQLRLAIESYKTTYQIYPFTLVAGTDDDLVLCDNIEGSGRKSGTYDDSGTLQDDIDDFDIDGDTYPMTTQTLLLCLSGSNTDLNPRGKVFLQLDADGRFTDAWYPWEEPDETDANLDRDESGTEETRYPRNRTGFHVAIDLNYDGIIAEENIAGRDNDLTGGVAIWSKGRDHLADEGTNEMSRAKNRDNVNSW